MIEGLGLRKGRKEDGWKIEGGRGKGDKSVEIGRRREEDERKDNMMCERRNRSKKNQRRGEGREEVERNKVSKDDN